MTNFRKFTTSVASVFLIAGLSLGVVAVTEEPANARVNGVRVVNGV